MKFRNYCIVVMGDTRDVLGEIIKVAETKPNVLDAKGILIATFSSVAEPRELTDYFKLNGRNFLIFDLSSENSGFHMVKDEINEGLFGFLKDMNDETLKQKTDSLIEEISSTTVTSKYHTTTSKSGTTESVIILEEQLQQAVENEDYELAVKLRDRIMKLETKSKKTR
jgi:hypothetical protein